MRYKRNLLLIVCFVLGLVGVVISSILKLGGNKNAEIGLGVSLVVEAVCLCLFLLYNLNFIKHLLGKKERGE